MFVTLLEQNGWEAEATTRTNLPYNRLALRLPFRLTSRISKWLSRFLAVTPRWRVSPRLQVACLSPGLTPDNAGSPRGNWNLFYKLACLEKTLGQPRSGQRGVDAVRHRRSLYGNAHAPCLRRQRGGKNYIFESLPMSCFQTSLGEVLSAPSAYFRLCSRGSCPRHCQTSFASLR
jgi:hypothetical protein